MKKISPEIITNSITLYKTGKSTSQVAVELGVSKTTIKRIIKREGITRKRLPKKYDDKHWLLHERKTKNATEIARILGVHPNTILNKLKFFGIVEKKIISESHRQNIIKSLIGRKHTEETKEKIRIKQIGELGHNWKGGTRIRYGERWRNIRKLILKRDDYKCQLCENSGGILKSLWLDVHHKIPARFFRDMVHAHSQNNLITLCKKCHAIEEGKITARNVSFGKDCQIWHYVNLYDSIFGDNVKIGSYTEIGGSKIGNNVTIGASVFIPPMVIIEDNAWIGPGVFMTNDKYPPSPKYALRETIIKKWARIGASVTLMCGITIGEGALIGAGAVVTKNIDPGEIWAGVPAKRFFPEFKPETTSY